MTGLVGIGLKPKPDHLLFARSIDVRAWWLC